MTEFRDLDEFLDDTIKLPIGGKTYVIAPVDAQTGLFFERLMVTGLSIASGAEPNRQVAEQLLDDDSERDLYQRALGPTMQEMIDDGVTWHRVKIAALTVIYHTVLGAETAAAFWSSGGLGLGEALAPNRATRRRTGTSTGEATTTPRRGSTSGTKSRRTNGKRRRGSRSPGTSS